MGKRARSRSAIAADLAVTVMGVGGFLGFLVAARMDDANASPFDAMAYAWFFGFPRAETVSAVVQIEAHRCQAETDL